MSTKTDQLDQLYSFEPSKGYIMSYNSGDFQKQYSGEEWRDSDVDMGIFGPCMGLYGENTQGPDNEMSIHKTNLQLQQKVDSGSTNAMHIDVRPQVLSCEELMNSSSVDSHKSEMIELERKGTHVFPTASFHILKKYGSRCRKLNGEKLSIIPAHGMEYAISNGQTASSIETIILLAAERFIENTSRGSSEIAMPSHPYSGSLLCQSEEDFEGVQLVQDLLSSAEKVGEKQYEHALKFLHECARLSSSRGTPVQRLVFYFTEALYEKIDRETGKISPKGLGKKVEDPIGTARNPGAARFAFHKELPLSQIIKFAGIQAVVDNIGEARKIHFVDLEIRDGIQCTILMQALLARGGHPIEHLKITAVGTKSEWNMEETGRQLTSFAHTLELGFSFNVVEVDNILDLDENLFEIDAEEVIVVYAEFTLTYLLGRPDHLNHLMRVMRSINPSVMIVAEVEANCNSPIFVDRFVEALTFYGAFFESMADCLRDSGEHRHVTESTCFSGAIRNVIAMEGEERKIRHVSLNVWRAFFAHFGLKETEFSMSSMYQAELVLENFTCGTSFTFDIDDKSLIIGWRGRPLSSLSTWKF